MTAARPTVDLAERLVAFARLLRARGVLVAPERVGDALQALDGLDPRRPREGYWALRCTLAAREDDLPRFDRAFLDFWGSGEDEGAEPPPQPSGDGTGEASGSPALTLVSESDDEDPLADDDAARAEQAIWSAQEQLRGLDFAAYGPEELRRSRRAMERLARDLPRRLERRLRRSLTAGRLDLRRTLVDALHTDGVPLRRAWRAPRERPFKLVLVLDVSGSMQAYARVLLMFAHAAVHADRRVEAFTFGTRLTRVTNALAERHPDRALATVGQLVPDWSSGTRIGENVRALNDRWGSLGMTRGAIVVILSDGWERGDPASLADELARLRRRARSLVWVNPLAGQEGYEPLAAGMAAALPHLDRFLAGHDLAALEMLVAVVCSLGVSRAPAPLAA